MQLAILPPHVSYSIYSTHAFLKISLLSIQFFFFLLSLNAYFFKVLATTTSPHLNWLRKCHQQSAGLSAVSLTGQCHPGAEYVLSSDNKGDSGMWAGTQGKNCRGSLRNDFCLFLISALSLGMLFIDSSPL